LAKTKDIAPLIGKDAFLRQGFQFSDIPTARAVVEIVGRLGGETGAETTDGKARTKRD
jgi:hypothetical protein